MPFTLKVIGQHADFEPTDVLICMNMIEKLIYLNNKVKLLHLLTRCSFLVSFVKIQLLENLIIHEMNFLMKFWCFYMCLYAFKSVIKYIFLLWATKKCYCFFVKYFLVWKMPLTKNGNLISPCVWQENGKLDLTRTSPPKASFTLMICTWWMLIWWTMPNISWVY